MSTLCFGNLAILLFEVLSFYVNIYVILRALLQISPKNVEAMVLILDVYLNIGMRVV